MLFLHCWFLFMMVDLSKATGDSSLMFVGYDCSRPTEQLDVALRDRPCGNVRVSLRDYRNATIQVIQRTKGFSSRGFRCKVTVDKDAFYCGE